MRPPVIGKHTAFYETKPRFGFSYPLIKENTIEPIGLFWTLPQNRFHRILGKDERLAYIRFFPAPDE